MGPVRGLNLSEWAIRHRTLVLFLMLVLSGAGSAAYLSLGRSDDPKFTVKTMVLSVTWPGATSEEMALQVTDKIEKKLQEVPYFDYVQSYSQPDSVTFYLYLQDSTPPDAVPDSWYQVRKKLDDIRATLPPGVQGPFVNDEFGDVYALLYALSTDGFTPAELKTHLEEVRNRLLRVPDVKKVDLLGLRDQKIFVELSYRKLAALGVSPQVLFESLREQNAVAGAGFVETHQDRVHLRVAGKLKTVDAIKAVPVQAGGQVLRLGDLAHVYRGYEDPPTQVMYHDGEPVYGLGIAMTEGGNILALGRNVAAEMKAIQAALPAGITAEQVVSQPIVVDNSIREFVRSLAEALAIVLVVTFISLGWRTGIVVALSVPLVLTTTFVIMKASGIGLHRVSLGALIIALGLLVDDAIIAVEMMAVKMAQGFDRFRAATFAYASTGFPMLTGTLVTAAAFLPVGFARASAGEYATTIFWVTGIALLVSWAVAVVFTPVLGYWLLSDGKAHGGQDLYQTPIYRRFRRLVVACLDHRHIVVALTTLCFVLSVIGFRYVPQQYFPDSERPELMVDLWLKDGSSIEATAGQLKDFERRVLADDPDILHYASFLGTGAPYFYLSFTPTLKHANYAQVMVVTKGGAAREAVRTRLIETFKRDFPLVRGRVARLEYGPPVGYPVQFRVEGPEPMQVREIAYRVRDAMRQNRHVRDVNLDWNELSRVVRLEVDQDRARLLGLTPQDIADQLQTLFSGTAVTQYREGIETIDVVARAVPAERLDLDRLDSVVIATASGAPVPLAQAAKVTYAFEEPKIWRRSRDTTISVRADVVDGNEGPTVTAELLPAIQRLEPSLPDGFRIEVGGAAEAAAKSQAAVNKLFPLMILILVSLLMIQLQSFSRLFLVLLTAPLGLMGVTASLLLLQAPFGFVAMLGVIALAGMTMRNSVILVDQIDQDVTAGSDLWTAIVDATIRRARPIVLTALAAVLAMIPLTRSVFGGPMAVAIMGGLTGATVLTLLYLPALYALWFRVRRPAPARAAFPGTLRRPVSAE